MKKPFTKMVTMILILLLLSSCGRLKTKTDTGYEPSVKTEAKSSNSTVKDIIQNKSERPSNTADIQNVSDEMDKLESIMNGLDDSADIGSTEEIINNLK